MNRFLSAALAAAFLGIAGPAARPVRADTEFGSWNSVTVKWLDTKYVDLVAMGQLRFRDDMSNLGSYLVNQRVQVAPAAGWGLGMGYSYLPFRSSTRRPWTDQHRIEIDATRRWSVTERLDFSSRARLELRWVEGRDFAQRIRWRPMLAFAVPNRGPLDSVYVSNEFFYELQGDDFAQNRLVPLGMVLKTPGNSKLTLYYQYWSLKGGETWRHSHVIGTDLSFSF